MISANQKYKQSGTTKSFKEWLVEEQKEGGLEVRNTNEFVSADGSEKVFFTKRNRNILIFLGLAAIGYGIYAYQNKKG